MGVIEWVKRNKLLTLVLIVVIYFLLNLSRTFLGVNILSLDVPSSSRQGSSIDMAPGDSFGVTQGTDRMDLTYPYPQPEYAPQPGVDNRLVIQESNVSLLVGDVVDARNKILEHARSVGGYMVNASTSSPEDAPYAHVTIRVPSENLQPTLDYLHSLSIKVVSENLVGRDVTDQYVDIDKRIETYERTKTKYEEILDRAVSIQDITNLTREIINTQSQIDLLKGQQESLEQNSQLAKLTIYLSTDEIALPYAPSETFRPAVIFKLAVRSLIGFLRDIATFAIWIGVYAVVWAPALAIYIFLRMRLRKRKSQPKQSPTISP
jgi:hypothetical protein